MDHADADREVAVSWLSIFTELGMRPLMEWVLSRRGGSCTANPCNSYRSRCFTATFCEAQKALKKVAQSLNPGRTIYTVDNFRLTPGSVVINSLFFANVFDDGGPRT